MEDHDGGLQWRDMLRQVKKKKEPCKRLLGVVLNARTSTILSRRNSPEFNSLEGQAIGYSSESLNVTTFYSQFAASSKQTNQLVEST